MTDETTHRLLCRAAAAAEARPVFLAHLLARYRRSEDLDDQGLARRLGLPASQLCALALCRRPRPDLFIADLQTIANRFAISPAALASVIRQVDALDALTAIPASGDGWLAAARDTDDDPADTEDETE